MSDEDIIAYRVSELEKVAVSHQKQLDVLMRAMWMLLGEIGFTQVALPLIERLT